jgi:GNAT superfamily N-acetyltransferase
MNDNPVFTSLTAEELLRDSSWWEIYEEAFPLTEREPSQVIVNSLVMGVGLAVAVRANDSTIAIATTQLLKDPPAIFLVYLATTKNLRGRGCGGELLEYAWKTGRRTLSDSGYSTIGLVAEVDAPDQSDSMEEKRIRERRIAFFSRHGAKLLPYSYTQPAVDGVNTVPMSLVFRPADGHEQPDSAFTDALVRAIYFEKYHAVNGISKDSLTSLLGAVNR